MVTACPALRSLRLANILDSVDSLAELVRTTSLQELFCCRVCDTEVTQALVRMTQLRRLTLHNSTNLSDAGALQLTVLTGLTSLCIQGSCSMTVGRLRPHRSSEDDELCYYCSWGRSAEVDIQLTSQCCPPDVWQQLRQLLAQHSTDGACLRLLMDEQQHAAAQQQEQLQQAQQQLQEAQQQLQQAQDTIARLQAQLAGGGQQQPA
ncbi:hypothetical protein OEZ86_006276 [Tetradesmus obliquus]|nr:hypothetical protein OEZ86_006276 [Tetradesmus obliquus]